MSGKASMGGSEGDTAQEEILRKLEDTAAQRQIDIGGGVMVNMGQEDYGMTGSVRFILLLEESQLVTETQYWGVTFVYLKSLLRNCCPVPWNISIKVNARWTSYHYFYYLFSFFSICRLYFMFFPHHSFNVLFHLGANQQITYHHQLNCTVY